MLNLFRFIARYHFFFLFLLLETISLSLYFSYNYFPQAYYFRMATSFHGIVRSKVAAVTEYFSLKTLTGNLRLKMQFYVPAAATHFLKLTQILSGITTRYTFNSINIPRPV